MADTVTFGGLTVGVQRFQEPRIKEITLFEHIPNADFDRATQLGKAGSVSNCLCWISEDTAALAQATFETWDALIGTSGTMSWTVGLVSDSATDVYLLDAQKAGRLAPQMPILLLFRKTG